MPKIHDVGAQHFVQYIHFPAQWGRKIAVRGWTQEINEPFRTSEPLIFKMPFRKALVLGKWTGRVEDEDEALMRATEWRIASYDDFTEEAGWTPAPEEAGGESSKDFDY